MCYVAGVSVGGAELACRKASKIFSMEDLTLADNYEEEEAIKGTNVLDATEIKVTSRRIED